MQTQRFEYSDGSSNKFWEIWSQGSQVYSRYGRIGADGQVTQKDAGSPSAAAAMLTKLIGEKTRKGYLQVAGTPGTTATTSKREPTKAAKVAKGTKSAKAAKDTKDAKANSANPAGAQLPSVHWKYDRSFSDVKAGLMVVNRGAELMVFEPTKVRTIELQWKSPTYRDLTYRIDLTGIAVVFHAGQPCIAASWRNQGNDGVNDPCDGPGIGLFDLTGAPLAIRYFWSERLRKQGKAGGEYDHVKLLATSLAGDQLAWTQGYTVQATSVADFIAGSEPASWPIDSSALKEWACYDGEGTLYGHLHGEGIVVLERAVSLKKLKRIGYRPSIEMPVATSQGLLTTGRLISGGKATTIESAAWSAAVKDDFVLRSAAGTGDVVCVSPGSEKKPVLCFVQLSTGKVLETRPLKNSSVDLHLVDGTLYVVGDKRLTAMPWPSDDLLGNGEVANGARPETDVLSPVKKEDSTDERPLYQVTVLEKQATVVRLRVTAVHPDVQSFGTDRFFAWKLLDSEAYRFDAEHQARKNIVRVHVSLEKGSLVSQRPGYLVVKPNTKAMALYTIEVTDPAVLAGLGETSFERDAWVGEHELVLGEMPSWRRFEGRTGSSAGFWQVRVDGGSMFEIAGKLGSEGKPIDTQFTSGGAARAQKELDKLVAKWRAKGYVELRG